MRDRPDAAAFVDTFAGTHRHVVDYLAEQVLRRQDPDLQRFLLETSVLDRLSGPLCDAVTARAGGQAALERLERANLFVVPLDDERGWYRYHQLFAGFLHDSLRRQEPDHVSRLHRRAALWHEQQNDAPQAFEHWLEAGDPAQAARLVVEAGKELLKRGEERLLLDWIDRLPAEVGHQSPWVGVYRTWALVLTGQVAAAEACLREVEQGIPRDADLATARRHGLAGEAFALHAYFALRRREAAQARTLGQVALEQLPVGEQSTRSVVHLTLALASSLLNEPAVAMEMLHEALRMGMEAGNLHAATPR